MRRILTVTLVDKRKIEIDMQQYLGDRINVGINDPAILQIVQVFMINGITDDVQCSENKLVWISPSQIKCIDVQFIGLQKA